MGRESLFSLEMLERSKKKKKKKEKRKKKKEKLSILLSIAYDYTPCPYIKSNVSIYVSSMA